MNSEKSEEMPQPLVYPDFLKKADAEVGFNNLAFSELVITESAKIHLSSAEEICGAGLLQQAAKKEKESTKATQIDTHHDIDKSLIRDSSFEQIVFEENEGTATSPVVQNTISLNKIGQIVDGGGNHISKIKNESIAKAQTILRQLDNGFEVDDAINELDRQQVAMIRQVIRVQLRRMLSLLEKIKLASPQFINMVGAREFLRSNPYYAKELVMTCAEAILIDVSKLQAESARLNAPIREWLTMDDFYVIVYTWALELKFEQACSKKVLEQLFAEFDIDGDGYISEADLVLKIECLIFKQPLTPVNIHFDARNVDQGLAQTESYETMASLMIPVPEIREVDGDDTARSVSQLHSAPQFESDASSRRSASKATQSRADTQTLMRIKKGENQDLIQIAQAMAESKDQQSHDATKEEEIKAPNQHDFEYLRDTHKLGLMASAYNTQFIQDEKHLNPLVKQEEREGQDATEAVFSPVGPFKPTTQISEHEPTQPPFMMLNGYGMAVPNQQQKEVMNMWNSTTTFKMSQDDREPQMPVIASIFLSKVELQHIVPMLTDNDSMCTSPDPAQEFIQNQAIAQKIMNQTHFQNNILQLVPIKEHEDRYLTAGEQTCEQLPTIAFKQGNLMNELSQDLNPKDQVQIGEVSFLPYIANTAHWSDDTINVQQKGKFQSENLMIDKSNTQLFDSPPVNRQIIVEETVEQSRISQNLSVLSNLDNYALRRNSDDIRSAEQIVKRKIKFPQTDNLQKARRLSPSHSRVKGKDYDAILFNNTPKSKELAKQRNESRSSSKNSSGKKSVSFSDQVEKIQENQETMVSPIKNIENQPAQVTPLVAQKIKDTKKPAKVDGQNNPMPKKDKRQVKEKADAYTQIYDKLLPERKNRQSKSPIQNKAKTIGLGTKQKKKVAVSDADEMKVHHIKSVQEVQKRKQKRSHIPASDRRNEFITPQLKESKLPKLALLDKRRVEARLKSLNANIVEINKKQPPSQAKKQADVIQKHLPAIDLSPVRSQEILDRNVNLSSIEAEIPAINTQLKTTVIKIRPPATDKQPKRSMIMTQQARSQKLKPVSKLAGLNSSHEQIDKKYMKLPEKDSKVESKVVLNEEPSLNSLTIHQLQDQIATNHQSPRDEKKQGEPTPDQQPKVQDKSTANEAEQKSDKNLMNGRAADEEEEEDYEESFEDYDDIVIKEESDDFYSKIVSGKGIGSNPSVGLLDGHDDQPNDKLKEGQKNGSRNRFNTIGGFGPVTMPDMPHNNSKRTARRSQQFLPLPKDLDKNDEMGGSKLTLRSSHRQVVVPSAYIETQTTTQKTEQAGGIYVGIEQMNTRNSNLSKYKSEVYGRIKQGSQEEKEVTQPKIVNNVTSQMIRERADKRYAVYGRKNYESMFHSIQNNESSETLLPYQRASRQDQYQSFDEGDNHQEKKTMRKNLLSKQARNGVGNKKSFLTDTQTRKDSAKILRRDMHPLNQINVGNLQKGPIKAMGLSTVPDYENLEPDAIAIVDGGKQKYTIAQNHQSGLLREQASLSRLTKQNSKSLIHGSGPLSMSSKGAQGNRHNTVETSKNVKPFIPSGPIHPRGNLVSNSVQQMPNIKDLSYERDGFHISQWYRASQATKVKASPKVGGDGFTDHIETRQSLDVFRSNNKPPSINQFKQIGSVRSKVNIAHAKLNAIYDVKQKVVPRYSSTKLRVEKRF